MATDGLGKNQISLTVMVIISLAWGGPIYEGTSALRAVSEIRALRLELALCPSTPCCAGLAVM